MRSVIRFLKRATINALNKTKEFFVGLAKHAEAVAVLSLSAIGLNILLGEIPFAYSLPMWIEAPMVIPVLSVLIILALIKSAELRAISRGNTRPPITAAS